MTTKTSAAVFKKFRPVIKKHIEKLTGIHQTFNVSSDYSKLLFIKQELKSSEYNILIEEFDNSLRRIHPEIISEIESMLV